MDSVLHLHSGHDCLLIPRVADGVSKQIESYTGVYTSLRSGNVAYYKDWILSS